VDSNTVTIVAAIVTVIGTIAGVVIANRLTYSRSSKEKLWDLRRPAYGQILSELGEVESICDDADEYINERDFQEYHASKAYNRHNQEIAEHMTLVRKRFSDDYLILSEDFIAIYSELTNEMRSDPCNSSPDEEHDSFAAAIRKHRPRLITLARREMALGGPSWLPSWFRLVKDKKELIAP
jgi:hypothetical protein